VCEKSDKACISMLWLSYSLRHIGNTQISLTEAQDFKNVWMNCDRFTLAFSHTVWNHAAKPVSSNCLAELADKTGVPKLGYMHA